MKSLFIALTLIVSSPCLASCPSLSGDFAGECQEVFKDPSNNKALTLEIRIIQSSCKSLVIETRNQDFKMTDTYDLERGLIEIIKTNSITVTSGGAYGQNGFSGSILYSSPSGSVTSFFHEYEVVTEDNRRHLLVNQKSRGYTMACKLPEYK